MKRPDPAFFDAELFPTPRSVAKTMLSRVSSDATHFLEPSAGRGDLALFIKGDPDRWESERYSRRHGITVDCIEQSQELVAILMAKFFPVGGYDFLDSSGVCYYDAFFMNPPFSSGD